MQMGSFVRVTAALALTAGILATAGFAAKKFFPKPPAPLAETAAPAPELTPEESRDLERYRNINALRIALDSYRNANKRYPAALAELSPKFLEVLPSDPAAQKPYVYYSSESAFRIDFVLEAGVFSLAEGAHFVTNRGFNLAVEGVSAAASPDIKTDESEKSVQDSDADGLADRDEEEIYGTDPSNPDTDSDSYSDGTEIQGGYNPLGAGPLTEAQKMQFETRRAALHPEP